MWLGFNGAGLQQWIGEAWSHRTFWTSGNDTDSMFTFNLTPSSDGGFLAAVFSRGVLKWDGRAMTAFGRKEGITEDVRCVVEAFPGVIWAGGRQALFESTNGRTFHQIYSLPLGFVNGLFKGPDGTWWAATSSQGLLRRTGTTWVPADDVNAQLPDQNVRQMVWRRNGDLWVVTDRGVIAFRGTALTPGAVELPAGLESALTLLERSDEEMWVGGVGGIAVGDRDSWRMLTLADGLPGATVYAMAGADDGAVWVGGSLGVGRFSEGRWQRFDASDGLISEEANALGVVPLANGDVLFGTMSGIAHFHAGVQALPLPDLSLHWRGAAAGQGTVDASFVLPAHDRRLHLEWMAPWPRPERVEYRTRIARPRPAQSNDAWSEPQVTPELRIQSLEAGTWTIEVAARVSSATAQPWTDPLIATVAVAPHWRETRWTIVGSVLGLGLVVFGLVRWRTRHLHRKADVLERAVQEAMVKVKVLRGLLPICAHCKKIRDDRGYWRRLEDYIGQHSEADFSHSMCPDCQRTHYPEMFD
ncbi:MAG: hypothetical protein HQ485_12640 [Acidobacteria bacterium]|nr:hypothetical protein [Acidobacteriota bacterium]